MAVMIVAQGMGPEPDSAPIPPSGGQAMRAMITSDRPVYRQRDPRWRAMRLGGSGESFDATGCTVCAVSMAVADCGVDIPPDSMNERLKRVDGFTRHGYIRWDAIEQACDGRVRMIIPKNPDFEIIDKTLQGGHSVIARIRLRNGLPHWVVISGKTRFDYLIRDPLGATDHLDTLGGYGSPIMAIRIILPAEP